MGGGRVEHPAHLGGHLVVERLVARGIDRPEHDVLPHQDAGPVAGLEEPSVLVDGATGDPQEVAPRGPGQFHRVRDLVVAGLVADRVDRVPAGSPAEDGHAVDHEPARAVGPVEGDRPEPDVAEVQRGAGDHGTYRVARLVAVGVGPPAFGALDLDDTGQAPAADVGRRRERRGASGDLELTPGRIGPGSVDGRQRRAGHDQLDRDGTRGRSPSRRTRGAHRATDHLDRSRPSQCDGAPRSHRSRDGGPSGLASEQGGPEPAQVLVGDPADLPARPGSTDRQHGVQGGEPHPEFVFRPVGLRQAGQVHPVGGEHRLGPQQVVPVEPHVGQRGETPEFEDPATVGGVRALRTREAAPVPPVPPVEVPGRGLRPSGVPQRAGHRPGHRGRQPLRSVCRSAGCAPRSRRRRHARPPGAGQEIGGAPPVLAAPILRRHSVGPGRPWRRPTASPSNRGPARGRRTGRVRRGPA